MTNLLVLFLHLLATCTAVGAIIATDLRLLLKVWKGDASLAPPTPFIAYLVGGSLVVLCLTGAWLISHGLQQRADFAQNPKLLAKLALVALLCLNAACLHTLTFPWLQRRRRIVLLSPRVLLGVATPIAMSNALWLFVAFLGIARPWNHSMPAQTIFAIAACLFGVSWIGVVFVLGLLTRDQVARVRPSSAPSQSLSTNPARHASAVLEHVRRKSLKAPTRRLEHGAAHP